MLQATGNSRIRRIARVSGGVALLWLVGKLALNWISTTLGLDPYTVLSSVKSPTSEYKAVLYTRDCGATCSMQNGVSICRANEDGSDSDAVVFVSDIGSYWPSSDGKSASYPVWVQQKWLTADHLLIRYPKSVRVFQSMRTIRVGGSWISAPKRITIDYSPTDG